MWDPYDSVIFPTLAEVKELGLSDSEARINEDSEFTKLSKSRIGPGEGSIMSVSWKGCWLEGPEMRASCISARRALPKEASAANITRLAFWPDGDCP